MLDGFGWREDQEWRRTYVLWRMQVVPEEGERPPTFEEFMGRVPRRESTPEEIEEFSEALRKVNG